MTFDEYRRLDATALAALVANRETTGAELLAVAQARAAETAPKLNAITIPMDEIAQARAAGPLCGPFAGVPFLIKDLFQQHAGVRITRGSRAMKAANVTATEQSEIVDRWLAAGVVVMGATNTPEFGSKAVTEPLAWGPSRNPWNLDHTPGGSSGGSAAAVAAGIVPMAGANDGGGSIRLPASMCGLFGFKPGRGLTPWGPPRGADMHGAAVNHVLARSVRDSAAMLDASVTSKPDAPFAGCVARDPKPLRIAFWTRSPIGETSPDAVQAAEDAARLLESSGHAVEPAEPEIDQAALLQDFLCVWFDEMAALVSQTMAETGAGREGFDPDTLGMALLGRAAEPGAAAQALARWPGYAAALARFHEKYDVYLTPTMARAPLKIGEGATSAAQHLLMRAMEALGLAGRVAALPSTRKAILGSLGAVPFTQLANIAGAPAMSVPLFWTAGGLPIGAQLGAAQGGEGMLFSLAGQLERARLWFGRVPPL